jgi:hypothetical protein
LQDQVLAPGRPSLNNVVAYKHNGPS